MNHHEEREEHEGREFDALSRQVIGCAIEVHRFLGPGLLESSYQRCLGRELGLNEIAYGYGNGTKRTRGNPRPQCARAFRRARGRGALFL